MKYKDLDLEYEFDMEDLQVGLLLVAAVCIFLSWATYMITLSFNYATLIPLILILMVYVVVDDHNDQTKTRNDKKIHYVLMSNGYYQTMHINAVSYLSGGYRLKK